MWDTLIYITSPTNISTLMASTFARFTVFQYCICKSHLYLRINCVTKERSIASWDHDFVVFIGSSFISFQFMVHTVYDSQIKINFSLLLEILMFIAVP